MLATPHHTPVGDDTIGATIGKVVTDAKAYAAAQVAVQKETLAARFRAGRNGIVFGVVALLLALAAIPALLVGLILSLAPLVGPLGATAIVILGTLAIAGVFGWLAARIIPRMFEPIA